MTREKLFRQLSRYDAWIGIGGSGIEGNDIDLVWIEDSLNFDKINKVRIGLTELMGKKVSITPMTTLMYEDETFDMWGAKFATMYYKGIDWVTEPDLEEYLSMEKLKEIIKKEAPFFLNHWMKLLANGADKDKAITLLLQEIALLS